MFRLYSVILALATVATSQTPDPGNPGVENTLTTCGIGGYPAPGQVYYYAPDDTFELGNYAESFGACTPNSYGRTWVVYPNSSITINGNVGSQFCGYQALNGQLTLMHCPGLIRGTAPEGLYNIYTDVGYGTLFANFEIRHSQVTQTAPTPTVPFTTTPSTTITTTLPTVEIDTVTSPPVTLTQPAATGPCTITVTPARSIQYVTSTKSVTVTERTFSLAEVTATATAKCDKPGHHTRGRSDRAAHHVAPVKRIQVRSTKLVPVLMRRYEDLQGVISGDGPPTTTVTPLPATSTVTAGTFTEIDTAYSTSTTTTTVPAVPPTVTVFSGTTTITTTLPAKTHTFFRITKATNTTTVGVTKTFTYTTTITPLC